jgi:hypothetical protein
MASQLKTLADAYAAALAAGVLSGKATPIVTFMPRIDLLTTSALAVYVLPVQRAQERQSLGGAGVCAKQTDLRLQVVFYRRIRPDDPAQPDNDPDAIADLAEDVQDATIGMAVGGVFAISCDMTSGDGRVLDLQEMEERQSFCAVLDITFRGIE